MKIDLNKPLQGLDGKDLDMTMGKVLATALANSAAGPAIKVFDWALKLHKGESLELDAADTTLFKSLVEGNAQLTVLSKAQILRALEAK